MDNSNETNPYAFYPESEDNGFKYPESNELAEEYGELQSEHEPRTPFGILVRKYRSFRLTAKIYELVIFHDRCEIMDISQATLVLVSREEASTHIQIRGRRIQLTDEDGQKHKFIMESPPDLNLARLVVWRKTSPENDSHESCLAVYDQLVINLRKTVENVVMKHLCCCPLFFTMVFCTSTLSTGIIWGTVLISLSMILSGILLTAIKLQIISIFQRRTAAAFFLPGVPLFFLEHRLTFFLMPPLLLLFFLPATIVLWKIKPILRQFQKENFLE
ncbi:MAG: hypothetical protein LBJ67_04180 [Planctomycetaceae bacterium]|jgi:hypothetical protein|nr:hypothetical protein [Planctomycetaceae bacterium]